MRPAMTEDELMHFGIKGMRWGVRRFQNPDGTRTPAGLKRYHDKPAFMSRRKYKKMKKQQAAQEQRAKSISEMSDEELDYAIRRKQKERQLEELLRDPNVQAKGQSKVKAILKESAQRLLKDASYKVGMNYVEKYLKAKDPDTKLRKAADKLKYQQDKLKYEQDKWNYNRKKEKWEESQKSAAKAAASKTESKTAKSDFYYQPKPATYPALPGPTAKIKKKKKK